MIGEDAFRVCGIAQIGTRSAVSGWSQYGTLTEIVHTTGGKSVLEYENHQARNYKNNSNENITIGGSRLKKSTFIDLISNIRNVKKYEYLQENGESSGFLALKPVYHFDDKINYIGAPNQYWSSSLYEQLLAETGRPAVGYSNVKESVVSEIGQNTNILGYTKSEFLQPLTSPSIYSKFAVTNTCVSTQIPNYPFYLTVCDTLEKVRPYQYWMPYHDNSIGSPTKVSVFNANNQLLSDKNLIYTDGQLSSATDNSQLAYRTFRMEGQNYNFENTYHDKSATFRQTADSTITFSLDGTKPITTVNKYTYKDQMPAEYQIKYPGKHNQLVKTTTTNSLGHQLESLTKYAADFDFGRDSIYSCLLYDTEILECLFYGYEYSPHIPTNAEAKGVYQLQQKHILSAVVETISKQNGNITGASYQNYDQTTALPKESFGIENLPRTNLTEVNYNSNTWTKDTDYDLKNTVISYNPIGLPIEIKERFGATSKIEYDATNTLPIKTYKNVGAADEQSTQTAYAKKIFGISKEIGTNGLEVRKEFYPNGKLKQVLDKDNNVLTHYTYLYRCTTDAVFNTNSDKNRIITRTPRIATADATTLTYLNCTISIQYLDGAGRSLLSVAYRASPNTKSIISGATGFDIYGRAIRNYLPVESDFDDGQFMDTTAVHNKAKIFYGDNICYSEVIYENSPLSRPLRSFGTGKAFRDNNKFSETKYETVQNQSDIKKITALVGQNKGFIGSYSDFQLFKKISLDERGSQTIEYSDKMGNTIRRDVQSTDNEYLTTAYIYDDANRLRYVLPPNAYTIIKNQAAFDENDPVFNEMIYAYHHDGRGRVFETHTPGTGWSRVVYNRLNQPVLTQDDDEASTNTWNFAQTDGQGRAVRTGQIQTTDSRATLQSYFDNYLTIGNNEAKLFEERSTAGENVAQYTNRSFPPQLQNLISETSLKTVAFYDDYSWRSGINPATGTASDYDFQDNPLNGQPYSKTNAKGLNTGGYIKDDLTGNLLMPAVSYYDYKNSSIQSTAYTHLKARDQSDTQYKFNREIVKTKAIYRQKNKADITRTTTHVNDHVGRPKTLLYGLSSFKNGAEFPMNTFNYDGIGRMKTKFIQPSANQIASTEQNGLWGTNQTWLGGMPNLQTLAVINSGHTVSIPSNANFEAGSLLNNGNLQMGLESSLTLGTMATVDRVALQSINYSYNIRNQLRGINLDESGAMQTSPEKLFSYKLDYHEDNRYFDGNISKQSWKSHTTIGGFGANTRSYQFSYDRSNRVKEAAFAGIGDESYSVSNISHDIMGNLKTMNRMGKTGANSWNEVDKLNYSYLNSGNKLQKVGDTGQNALLGGFINGTNTGDDYSYTNAGKITQDLNKGINQIEYNFLDLVKKQTFTDGREVEYGYSSTGQRRMRKVTKNGQTSYTFYNGEIVYTSPDANIENAVISEIQNAEGRYVGGKFTYGYTDQVGNLRLSYRDSVLANGDLIPVVIQENAYDIWGANLDGLDYVKLDEQDKYLISGKEQDSESGNTLLDWRDYDPTTGRMKNPDPAGQTQMQSGYAYCGNNPVIAVDPDGRLFFLIPQISWSKKGGLSLGLEFGVGVPGVLSASVTAGRNFKSKSNYWSVQGSAGGAYAGYGSQGGFAGYGYKYAGLSAGVSYGRDGFGSSLSFGSTNNNFNSSLGLNWSQSSGFDISASGGYTLNIERKVSPLTVLADITNIKSGNVFQDGNYDCVFACLEFLFPMLTQTEYKNKAGNPELGLNEVQIDGLIKALGKKSLPWNGLDATTMASQINNGEYGILSTKTGEYNLNHAVVPRKIETRTINWSFNGKSKSIMQFNVSGMNPDRNQSRIWKSGFSKFPTQGLRYFQIKN
jgi:RHS repeat-associated protein